MKSSLSLLIAVATLGGVAGCRGQTSTEPPIVPLSNRVHPDRYDPQAESDFFPDHRTMRTPVEGTIPRERDLDPEVGQGRLVDDTGYVQQIPDSVVTRMGGMTALID